MQYIEQAAIFTVLRRNFNYYFVAGALSSYLSRHKHVLMKKPVQLFDMCVQV